MLFRSNEKKLCDIECLWWCPRRDGPPAEDGCCATSPGEMGCEDCPAEAEAEAEAGGRTPKVKPSRKARWPGPGDALGMGTPSSGGGTLKSSSCAPSSAMLVAGSEPGRGKYTERLREWMRECLRGGAALGFAPFSMGEVGGPSSGAVGCEGSLFGGMASCWGGNDEESGEGVIGENGPDIERVREWACE